MRDWLYRLFQGPVQASKGRHRRQARPGLEALEDRLVPALTYHGGPIIPAMQAQAVYLGSDWTTNLTLAGQTLQFDDFLAKTVGRNSMDITVGGSYMDMLGNAGFTGPNGTVVGRGKGITGVVDRAHTPLVTDVNNYSGTALYDSTIQSDLQADIKSGLVQAPTANAVYFVFVQDNAVVDEGNGANSTNSFLAYHSSFAGVDASGNAAQIRYAVTPYHGSNGFYNNPTRASNLQEPFLSTFDSMTMATSHELAEIATDPDPGSSPAWYDLRGNEVGDIVKASTVYLNGYAVQREAALPGSTSNFLPMTPAGATAGHQAAFSLRQNGDLYVFDSANPTGTRVATRVASISDQGIDGFGQPMVDLVFTNGTAEEYHDFLPGNALLSQYPNLFPFTSLGSNVKQAKAGQGVSYVLFTNGNLEEYVDPNYCSVSAGYGVNPTGHRGAVIASGVLSIDAGTDKLGVNSVDYTVKTTLYEWRDVTATATPLASGVTLFSAGQQGMHAYAVGSSVYLYSEATPGATQVKAGVLNTAVTSLSLGVSATGGYLLEVVYSGGAAYAYNNDPSNPSSLGASGPVASVSKTLNGVVRVLLTSGAAYQYPSADPTFWADTADKAVA